MLDWLVTSVSRHYFLRATKSKDIMVFLELKREYIVVDSGTNCWKDYT